MEFALDQSGRRVHAFDADKGKDYFCPVCNRLVIPRQGDINVWHYAHSVECDDKWHYDMSAWHQKWQEQFPKGNREIVIEFDGEKHRADILAYGYVLEFQHSPLSYEEFNKRNLFYTKAGKKVIWIFDLTSEALNRWRLNCYNEWRHGEDNGGKWEWKHSKKCFINFVPQEQKNISLFFQIAKTDFAKDEDSCYIERVIWAPATAFRYFMTSYYPGTKTELLEWMRKGKL